MSADIIAAEAEVSKVQKYICEHNFLKILHGQHAQNPQMLSAALKKEVGMMRNRNVAENSLDSEIWTAVSEKM